MNPIRRPLACPWLVHPEALHAILRADPAAYAGLVPNHAPAASPRDDGPGYALADGVAVVPVHGMMYRHATAVNDLMAWALGGVSADRIADAVRAAVADPAARAILLSIDSPGGEAAGVGELASLVRSASAAKPLAAFVEYCCCSGAYWLAAAAGEITAAPLAIVGSIGAYCVAEDDSELMANLGVREHVIQSEQSPLKYPDVATEAGRAVYQKRINDVAAVFIADVARYRGTTAAAVESGYGRGAALIASEALAAGMVDKVGTLADAIAKLSGRNRARLAVSRPAAASTRGPAAPPRLRLRPR